MAHIIHWFRQLFCDHKFKLFAKGTVRVSNAPWKYMPTWHDSDYWETHVCEKCLFTKNVDTKD
jgi:hypothetical protein